MRPHPFFDHETISLYFPVACHHRNASGRLRRAAVIIITASATANSKRSSYSDSGDRRADKGGSNTNAGNQRFARPRAFRYALG